MADPESLNAYGGRSQPPRRCLIGGDRQGPRDGDRTGDASRQQLLQRLQPGLSAAAYSSLAGARGGRVTEDESFGLVLTDTASRSMFGNVVVVGRPLDPDRWESAAARMHDFYGDADGGPFLVFSAWPTPDMVPFGFGRIGHPPLMLRAPGTVPAAEVPGLEIRPVSDAAGAEAWEWALVEGFPEPELQLFQAGCFLPDPALRVPGWHHWVGYLDDRPAGTASAFVTGTHVDVEFISTVEWARDAASAGPSPRRPPPSPPSQASPPC